MWKKVGSVHSGDDKSNRSVRSRSRDQFPTQAFHESVQKVRNDKSQIIDNQNTYFCHNHVEKRKRSDGNRSLSKIKTQRELGDDLLKTTLIQKRHTSGRNHQDNQSLIGQDRQEQHSTHLVNANSQQKLKRLTKPSQLKQLRENHNKLKEFVKFQIKNFKKGFQDLRNQLKFEINYRKQMTDRSEKTSPKDNLVPIVPYRFKSQILDTMNLRPDQSAKKQKKKNQNVGINNQSDILGLISNQGKKLLEQVDTQYTSGLNKLLSQYGDINLEQLLA